MRKLTRKIRPVMVGINKHVEKRETRREAKALKASRLTAAIEQELLDRLKSGLYESEENKQDIINLDPPALEKAARQIAEEEGTEQFEPDLVEEEDNKSEKKELELETEGGEGVEREFVEDFEPEESDLEDFAFREAFGEGVHGSNSSSSSSSSSSSTSTGTKKRRREIEIEIEREDQVQNENFEIN